MYDLCVLTISVRRVLSVLKFSRHPSPCTSITVLFSVLGATPLVRVVLGHGKKSSSRDAARSELHPCLR